MSEQNLQPDAAPVNGKPQKLTPKQIRRRLREAQDRVQLKQLELMESYLWYDDFGGSDILDRIRRRDSDSDWIPITPNVASDRKHGANWPLWRSEQELSIDRQQSRAIAVTNPYGRGMLRNLTNHIIGVGFTYKCQPVDENASEPGSQHSETAQKMAEACQKVVDEFCAINRWNTKVDPRKGPPANTREREGFRRVIRDGDTLIRFFPVKNYGESGQPNFCVHVRFMEPAELVNPANGGEEDGWSFGIQHRMEPFEDVEDVLFYNFRGPDGKDDIVPAREVIHIKPPDEDSTVKRGLPEFTYGVADALERAVKLQRNASMGSAIRNAIAMVSQHSTATPATAQSFVNSQAERFRTDPMTGRQKPVRRYSPGTVLDIGPGKQFVPPPSATGVSENIEVLQADLRQCAAALCAPEYFTADASNANYSSTQEAGAPWVRAAEAMQEHFVGAYLACIWRAIGFYIDAGYLPRDVFDAVEISAEAPQVVVRNELEKTQENEILMRNRIKSPQTWQGELGIDPEVEARNFAEFEQQQGPMAGTGPGQPGLDQMLGGDAAHGVAEQGNGPAPQPESGGSPGAELPPKQASAPDQDDETAGLPEMDGKLVDPQSGAAQQPPQADELANLPQMQGQLLDGPQASSDDAQGDDDPAAKAQQLTEILVAMLGEEGAKRAIEQYEGSAA